MRILLLIVLLAVNAATRAADPMVSNVLASQRPRTKMVDITYDVADPDSTNLTVTVAVSTNGGASYFMPGASLSGAVGANVAPGVGKLVTWNGGMDLPAKLFADLRVQVTACDETPTPYGMVWIPAGTFTMGSPSTEPGRVSKEDPQTQVTISRGFWMSEYETTQGEYQAVMGANPSQIKGDTNRPVEMVSWSDATNYCAQLTARERAAARLPAGYAYRLPTEAEWEYCCRAGTTTAMAYGNSLSSTQANFNGDYPYGGAAKGPYLDTTIKVGSYAPNAWGLYDMHGNVWEWCLDWYGNYPGGSVTDPRGPNTGSYRVIRGGSWYDYGSTCRSARRYSYSPVDRYYNLGFRVVLAPGQ